MRNHLLTKVYNRRAIEVDAVVEELLSYAERLRPMVCDTSLLLNQALDAGQTVLFEGAQATMLDVDHGTYPFVTSSNPVAGGVCVGAGIGPTRIDRVIGVIKAYTTRVGSGPFPTELFDEDGINLQKLGGEIGVSTGRTRRCGWYDAVVARYASRVNGLTEFFLTKLDILGAWDRIPVCVAYEIDGQRVDEMPMTQTEFHHAKPIYEYFEGWKTDISGCRSFDELPKNAQVYVAGARGDLRREDLGRRGRARARADGGRPRVKALVVGTGGREHALALALARDPAVTEVHAAPGNPGIGAVATLHDVDPMDGAAVAALATSIGADLVVVGPEAPLVAGSPTLYATRGIACFGPSARRGPARGLQGLLQGGHGHGRGADRGSRTCTTPEEAAAALDAFGAPYVVKDDALAAGKGVVVTNDRDEALAHAAGVRAGSWSRSSSTAPRSRSSRSATAPRPSPCCRPRTSSASSTAAAAPTPAAWAPTRRCRGLPAGMVETVIGRVVAADPRRDARAGARPSSAALRRAGADRGGPEGDRVQRAASATPTSSRCWPC